MVNYFTKINTRKFGIRQEIYSSPFSRFYSKQRYTCDDLSKLINVVWFFTFLIFAMKIGGAALFTLYDMNGMHAALNSEGIIVPKADYSTKWEGSSRHLMHVSIHEDGHVRVEDGAKIYPEDFKAYFLQRKACNPIIKAFLIVDKKCKMMYVQEVIQALKKANLRNVIFFTSKSGNTKL